MKGLALLLAPGKAKGKGDSNEEKPKPKANFDKDASEVFGAIKDDDEEGFKKALKLAIQSCNYDE